MAMGFDLDATSTRLLHLEIEAGLRPHTSSDRPRGSLRVRSKPGRGQAPNDHQGHFSHASFCTRSLRCRSPASAAFAIRWYNFPSRPCWNEVGFRGPHPTRCVAAVECACATTGRKDAQKVAAACSRALRSPKPMAQGKGCPPANATICNESAGGVQARESGKEAGHAGDSGSGMYICIYIYIYIIYVYGSI